ncbi:MAG: response regulator [Flavobacteriales bacterium]
MRVLLVEDDLVSQFLMKETLSLWNKHLEVDLADNGLEAIEKMKVSSYDLLLLYIQMPKMDGYEVTRIIRNEFPVERRNIPIIAMTGQASFQSKQFGMDDFIAKPFESDVLFQKIEKIASSLRND